MTVRKHRQGAAPSAGCRPSRASRLPIDRRIARTISNVPPREAITPVQRNATTMPSQSSELVGRAAPAEQQQQQVADDHGGGSIQRQMHQAVDQRLAPEELRASSQVLKRHAEQKY